MTKSKSLAILVALALLVTWFAVATTGVRAAVDFEAMNKALNEDTDLGEGSKANPVAVIPYAHVDGPRDESDFVAFVNFKYVARDYVKYQVSYISCTCRPAAYNYWSTAYVELSLPASGLLDDAVVRTLSFELDGEDKYQSGFWGDSDPVPSGVTYAQIRDEYLPFFVGKSWAEIKDLHAIEDIDPVSFADGDGREDLSLDAYAGATVSTNNVIRLLSAVFNYHGTDYHFENDPSLAAAVDEPADVEEEEEVADDEEEKSEAEVVGEVVEQAPLPPPRDLTKTYKPSSEATEDEDCVEDCYLLSCSSITSENLLDYWGRDDVLYIDLRNYEDYVMKHLRNFEVVPFFGLIFNAEAHEKEDLIQLYGGSPQEPVPVYEESDMMLELLFPKDQTLFILCQSGGRVAMLMEILAARGWDMSKIYNIGGMAQYTGREYAAVTVDTAEFGLVPQYTVEGLTRIAP